MVLRKITGVIGLVILVIGLMEVVLVNANLAMSQAIADLPWLRLLGIIAFAVGVVLVSAAAARQVGLRIFVWVFGIYEIIAGLVIFFGPEIIRDLFDALIFNRSSGFQIFMFWTTGLIRCGLGIALIYAAMRPQSVVPVVDSEPLPEHPQS
ncbi:MAG: hypothetical protein ACOX3G_00990 [Armatimonadota bacterium]|jgi:uncharacterized protein YjeT (DUF2065 family)